MVFEWLFGDVFVRFHEKAKRLQKFVRLIRNLEKNDFKEIQITLKKMRRLHNDLSNLHANEKKNVIDKINDEEFKNALSRAWTAINNQLEEAKGRIENAFNLNETLFLKGAYLPDKLNDLRKQLKAIVSLLEQMLENDEKLIAAERGFRQRLREGPEIPPVKINVSGKLSNGWSLRNIQDVIVELGGWIVKNPGGQHPYSIQFKDKRSIPLAESTPYNVLIRQVNKITGIENYRLRNSFAAGRLLP